MAADALTNLMQNRDVIKKIMAMDSNGKMDRMVENAVLNGNMSYNSEGANYTPQTRLTNNFGDIDTPVMVNETVMKKSKMPKAVLESFKANPGNTSLTPSVLDTLNLQPLNEIRKESRVQEQSIQSNGSVIDYSLLRTIINDAVQENVKKYISALSKKLLSEGVNVNGTNDNTVQAVKFGEKFSFITENGDVYEATLKYKTNLNTKNDKKKK